LSENELARVRQYEGVLDDVMLEAALRYAGLIARQRRERLEESQFSDCNGPTITLEIEK
jgi:hypothetical protein